MPTATHPARHVSLAIERPPDEVYAFASDPRNLPLWAKGLSGSVANVAGEWVAESPLGTVKVRFVSRNGLGVLDHDVVMLASGATFHNPMRVVPNGDGSEVVFRTRVGGSHPRAPPPRTIRQGKLDEARGLTEGLLRDWRDADLDLPDLARARVLCTRLRCHAAPRARASQQQDTSPAGRRSEH